MTEAELLQQIALGEDSRHQFKRTITHPDALAAELVAFSNSGGGTLFIGVDDDGSIAGLDASRGSRCSVRLFGNSGGTGKLCAL